MKESFTDKIDIVSKDIKRTKIMTKKVKKKPRKIKEEEEKQEYAFK